MSVFWLASEEQNCCSVVNGAFVVRTVTYPVESSFISKFSFVMAKKLGNLGVRPSSLVQFLPSKVEPTTWSAFDFSDTLDFAGELFHVALDLSFTNSSLDLNPWLSAYTMSEV